MAPPVRTVSRLRRPERAWLLGSDVDTGCAFIVVVTLGLWWRHGGLDQLLAGGTETLRAVGQLSGLVAALAALGAIVLTARPAFLERRFGLDSMLAAHRWFGIVTVTTVVVHAVVDTWAWAASTQQGLWSALLGLLADEPWMVSAAAATMLFLVIGLTSWRRIKRRMTYETWYFVHTLGYLAVLLGFGHQFTLGTDIATDTVAMWWWAGLAVIAMAIAVWARIGVIVRSVRNRLYVSAVSREASGTSSIHLNGPALPRMRVAAGQYFLMRPLAKGLWWQAHPFSVSAAPTTGGLRFTVKELGDDTPALVRLSPGTPVLLEGPYGTFTVEQAHGAKVVLFAGGVGIAPIRAILEDCHSGQQPVVIVRVHDEGDLAHRAELERLVASRQGQLHVLAGPRRWFAQSDPFSGHTLRAWIPDIAERHAFVCGPPSLESAILRGLRKAGMPAASIHHEQFGA